MTAAFDWKGGVGMSFNIAIDGPAGAGKSTVARKIAEKLGFIYIDTGAMYRSIALYLLRKGIDAADMDKISAECQNAEVSISHENGEQIVYLNGENVNGQIRTEEVGNMASAIGINPDVRRKLVELQRKLAADADVVMDGRDICSEVLPNAQVKVYLTADSRVRAKRRYEELTGKGIDCDLDAIEKDIVARDHQDMTRKISPLVKAEDAVLIDSSRMSISEVVDAVIALKTEHPGQKKRMVDADELFSEICKNDLSYMQQNDVMDCIRDVIERQAKKEKENRK